jgi:hypothetical protein
MDNDSNWRTLSRCRPSSPPLQSTTVPPPTTPPETETKAPTNMLANSVFRGAFGRSYRPLASFLSVSPPQPSDVCTRCDSVQITPTVVCSSTQVSLHSTISHFDSPSLTSPSKLSFHNNSRPSKNNKQSFRTILSSSSFSALPLEEEQAEKLRVDSLSDYQKEMELREYDAQIARLQTLRAINTGELYTLRGKFKMLSRDYGMGFLAWYWTVWFTTAGLSYAAIELGGVDPIMVASKVEMWMGWENGAISGKLDPTLGQIGLVVAVNECLEPLRLPVVVLTTKPVVNFFTRK